MIFYTPFLRTILLLIFILSAGFSPTFGSSYFLRMDVFFGGPVHKTNEPYPIAGKVTYMGNSTLQSVYLNWQIGHDGAIRTVLFEDIDLNPYYPFVFEDELPFLPREAGSYLLKYWFSGLNGADSQEQASDVIEVELDVYDHLVDRDMTMVESFSSINCGSCVWANIMLRNLIENDTERYTVVYYHPLHYENSPLYHFNPKDQDARRFFYEVFYTPLSVVGSIYYGGTENVEESLLLRELRKWSGFDIRGQWFVEDEQLFVHIETDVFIDVEDPEKDYRLFIVATQDTLSFTSPPGSNGEKDFYDVMRFFAPDATGISLDANYVNGLDHEFTMRWFESLEIDRISLLAFVQDMNTRNIQQVRQLEYEIFMNPEDPESPEDPQEPEEPEEPEEPQDPEDPDDTNDPGEPTSMDTEKSAVFSVFPNPARDRLFVSLEDRDVNTDILLLDHSARIIKKKNGVSDNKYMIDVSDLAPGLYLLQVHTPTGRYTRKISIIP